MRFYWRVHRTQPTQSLKEHCVVWNPGYSHAAAPAESLFSIANPGSGATSTQLPFVWQTFFALREVKLYVKNGNQWRLPDTLFTVRT